MRFQLLTSALTVSALTLASNLIASNPARANQTTFVCGSSEGVPTTMAQTAKGQQVPIIRWVSEEFSESGYDPQTRCEIVSNQFQEYYAQGSLKYLTTGRKNGLNIVCVAESEGGACVGQLFTLRDGTNPGETLQRLMAVRYQASSKPLNESSTRVYIDMEKYLEQASASQETSEPASVEPNQTPSEPQAQPQSQPQSDNKPSGGLW